MTETALLLFGALTEMVEVHDLEKQLDRWEDVQARVELSARKERVLAGARGVLFLKAVREAPEYVRYYADREARLREIAHGLIVEADRMAAAKRGSDGDDA